MKRLLLLAPILLLAACGNQYDNSRPTDGVAQWYEDHALSSSSSSSVESSSSSSSSASSLGEMKTIVLVDQSFETAASVSGAARLSAMRVKKLTGNVSAAEIHFELSRNGQNDGVAGVTVYSADLNDNGSINPETEWKRFRAIGSWLGGGKCQLAGSNELLSGKGETVSATYSLNAVPVSSTQPECSAGTTNENFVDRLNSTGIALGFLTTNPAYNLRVTVTYFGDLTAISY